MDSTHERFARLGVDVDAALQILSRIPLSLHCWQGDDVAGFEGAGSLDGGLAVTGNYPGRARNADELRADLDLALRLIPGRHRVNLHAIYAETGGRKVERDELAPEHFARWIDWARNRGLHGLDFNPTCFAHPLSADGFTLSSRDDGRRAFWVRHVRACRRIGAFMGREMGTPTITNVWIPDGYKDTPADRVGPRLRLLHSLDEAFAEPLDPAVHLDSMEGKLFGIGAESYTVGSHEFYLAYAVSRAKMVCLDAGHYHPTESIVDKISSLLAILPRILLHVSRGVRWDSDHVVTLSDELIAIAQEAMRREHQGRVHIGLDYFDASINRIAAWVIGARNMVRALLVALLQPVGRLEDLEAAGDFTGRLALQEESRLLPYGEIWDHYCRGHGVPVGLAWLDEVRAYEARESARRA